MPGSRRDSGICRECGQSSPFDVCIACIKRRLADRIEALLETLFPEGCYERGGREFRVGSLAGEAGRSLVVEIGRRDRVGLWYDHAAGRGGDLIDLIAALNGNDDTSNALRWVRQWLRLPMPQRRERGCRSPEASPEAVQRQVERIWAGASPLRRGDWVDRYLGGRNIDLATLAAANNGRLPGSLRCHPRLWCDETKAAYPALVAAIVDRENRLVGVHRTWLAERGDGRIGKAALIAPKRSRGHYRGGAVRLWRGISRAPWNAAPATDIVAISEGIEDGLSAALAQPAWRVAAAVSLSAMLSIELPANIEKIVLVTQNDPPGSPAAETLARVRARFHAAGKQVWLLQPPRWVKDVNEALQLKEKTHG